MSIIGKIVQLFNKDIPGEPIFPKTREKAVYDDDNVRLDNKLADLPKQFYSLQGGIEIPEGADLNDPMYRQTGNYYCETNAVAATIINKPEGIGAFNMKVFYSNGTHYPIQEVISVLYGVRMYRVYNNVANVWSQWINYLSATDIINNDTTGGTDKVFSAEAGKVLGQEIDAVNNKLKSLNVVYSAISAPATINLEVPSSGGMYVLFCAPSIIDGVVGMYLLIANNATIVSFNTVVNQTSVTISRNNRQISLASASYFYYSLIRLA